MPKKWLELYSIPLPEGARLLLSRLWDFAPYGSDLGEPFVWPSTITLASELSGERPPSSVALRRIERWLKTLREHGTIEEAQGRDHSGRMQHGWILRRRFWNEPAAIPSTR